MLFCMDLGDTGYELGHILVAELRKRDVRASFSLDHYLTRQARLLIECASADDAQQLLLAAADTMVAELHALK